MTHRSSSFPFNEQGRRECNAQIDNSQEPLTQSKVPSRQRVLSGLNNFASSSGQIDDVPEHFIAVLHSLSARH